MKVRHIVGATIIAIMGMIAALLFALSAEKNADHPQLERGAETPFALRSSAPVVIGNGGAPTSPAIPSANREKSVVEFINNESRRLSTEKGALYNEIERKTIIDGLLNQPVPRSHDSQATLHRLLEDCRGLDGLEREGFLERDLKRIRVGASFYEERMAAYNKKRSRCQGVAKELLDPSALARMLNQMHNEDNPVADATMLRPLFEARPDIYFDRFRSLLSSTDPLIIEPMRDFVLSQFATQAMLPDLAANGINVSDLRVAWRLVECDFAGGCGPNSLQVLAACSALGYCEATSEADLRRRYYPSNFQEVQRLRGMLLYSYQTNDWQWLLIDRLRPKS